MHKKIANKRLLLAFFIVLCYNIYMRNKKLFIIFGILLSLTLLITICSAVFSIKTVNAHCINSDDKAISTKVEEAKEELLGRNIFMINESELSHNIESRVSGIRVINVERLFPDIVTVHFIKLYTYFEMSYNGSFYRFAKDGKISEQSDHSGGEDIIKVRFDFDGAPKVDQSVADYAQFKALIQMVDYLEQMEYPNTDATVIISAIDFTYNEYAIYIPMRSGVIIKLRLHDKNDYTDVGIKLQKALSFYMADANNRRNGTIEAGSSNVVTYSEKNDYIYEEN